MLNSVMKLKSLSTATLKQILTYLSKHIASIHEGNKLIKCHQYEELNSIST